MRRLLLDSHVLVWWFTDHRSLGAACRSAIGGADEVFVSAVSPWELGIKRALGKIDYPDAMMASVVDEGLIPLPVDVVHGERAPTLPPHHRDPFDRMLVAQAQIEGLVLATADGRLSRYDVEVLPADR